MKDAYPPLSACMAPAFVCRQVLAMRVWCRLVAQGGPASCALLLHKEEGWLEAVLTHFLSPLVLQVSGPPQPLPKCPICRLMEVMIDVARAVQEEHEAVEELVLACLGNAPVGARLVHCVVSTGHTVHAAMHHVAPARPPLGD